MPLNFKKSPIGLAMALFTLAGAAQAQSFKVQVPIAPAEHAPTTVSHDFGKVAVGSQPAKVFTFTNKGASPTTVSELEATGGARVLTHNCVGVLQPNISCSMTLALQVAVEGINKSRVNFRHSAVHNPDIYALSATGVAASSLLEFSA